MPRLQTTRSATRCSVDETAAVQTAEQQSPLSSEPVAGPFHTLFLLCALAAIAALGYSAAHRITGVASENRIALYVLTTAWEWAAVGYIYWGLRRRGKSFQTIAGERWQGASTVIVDVAIALAFWFVALIILYAVALLIHSPGMQQAARNIAPQNPLETAMWILLSITAGICEETIFRGYLQRQFAAWTRNRPCGVLLSAVLFGAGHIYQGGRATIVIGVYGLLFGILAELRKNLRPGMITHAWHDSISGLALHFLSRRVN